MMFVAMDSHWNWTDLKSTTCLEKNRLESVLELQRLHILWTSIQELFASSSPPKAIYRMLFLSSYIPLKQTKRSSFTFEWYAVMGINLFFCQ